MVDIISAIGLFLAIEGALYTGFPHAVKKMAFEVSQMDEDILRRVGFAVLCAGVVLVWFVRG